MPRYVVLHHETPESLRGTHTHWDLMFEDSGVLRTWALAAEPQSDRELVAESLPDHRVAYLDYEGSLSGNRGEVQQWDAGEYECLTRSPEMWIVRLHGRRLIGTAKLHRSPGEPQRWTFLFCS